MLKSMAPKKKRLQQSKAARRQQNASSNGREPEYAAFGDKTMPNFSILDIAVRAALSKGVTEMYYIPVNQYCDLWVEEVYDFICYSKHGLAATAGACPGSHILKMICHPDGLNIRATRIRESETGMYFVEGSSGIKIMWEPKNTMTVSVTLGGAAVVLPAFPIDLENIDLDAFRDLGDSMMNFAKYDRVRVPPFKHKPIAIDKDFPDEQNQEQEDFKRRDLTGKF